MCTFICLLFEIPLRSFVAWFPSQCEADQIHKKEDEENANEVDFVSSS